jgi:tetratricopeptide (TPR) repeat protein
MTFCRFILICFLFTFTASADQKDSRLNHLFHILSKTNSDIEINKVTSSIWNIWLETNDPLIDLDFNLGLKSMKAGDLRKSLTFFSRVIEKNSNFAEAWNKRATVYYMLGDFHSSMLDINETLKLEPRHFGAMDGMSLIFIHSGEFREAVFVYDQMLKIFPKNGLIIQKRKHLLKMLTEST